MKIGFIGTGFIGGNMAENFKERGFDVVQYSLDEKYKDNLEELKKAEIVFVAVPTPTKDRVFDRSVLENALENTVAGQKIVIKSTVKCGTTDYFQKKYRDRLFFHSAEFLTERNARKDVDEPSRNVVGATKQSMDYIEDIMSILPKAKHGNIYCTAKVSELGKYASNFLLTAKILMANLIYDVCEEYGVDYDGVKMIAGSDDRIGLAHLNAEFEGGRGANGHCFPKDMATFHEMYNEHSIYGDLLLEVMELYNTELNLNTNKQVDIITEVMGKDFIDTCIRKGEIS